MSSAPGAACTSSVAVPARVRDAKSVRRSTLTCVTRASSGRAKEWMSRGSGAMAAGAGAAPACPAGATAAGAHAPSAAAQASTAAAPRAREFRSKNMEVISLQWFVCSSPSIRLQVPSPRAEGSPRMDGNLAGCGRERKTRIGTNPRPRCRCGGSLVRRAPASRDGAYRFPSGGFSRSPRRAIFASLDLPIRDPPIPILPIHKNSAGRKPIRPAPRRDPWADQRVSYTETVPLRAKAMMSYGSLRPPGTSMPGEPIGIPGTAIPATCGRSLSSRRMTSAGTCPSTT